MAPPSYIDLDKEVRNLFREGYHYGFWRLSYKTTTQNGVEFASFGQMDTDSGKVCGHVEARRSFLDNSISSSNKWSTDRTLHTTLMMEDVMTPGLDVGVVSAFTPQNNTVKSKLKLAYGCRHFKLDVDSTFAYRPLVNMALVCFYEGFYFGRQVGYETETLTTPINNVALGYMSKDFIIHSTVSETEQFLTSVFHRISELVDVGVQLSWFSEFKNVKLGFGTMIQLNSDSILRIKMDNTYHLAFGVQRRFGNGCTLFLSTLFDCRNPYSNDHKVGVALEVEI